MGPGTRSFGFYQVCWPLHIWILHPGQEPGVEVTVYEMGLLGVREAGEAGVLRGLQTGVRSPPLQMQEWNGPLPLRGVPHFSQRPW